MWLYFVFEVNIFYPWFSYYTAYKAHIRLNQMVIHFDPHAAKQLTRFCSQLVILPVPFNQGVTVFSLVKIAFQLYKIA